MSFGQNLQLLRRMRRGMTQEELADRMGVSRQTVSKWETDLALPEMDKVTALCDLFSCSMDQLVREDMTAFGEAYSDVRTEWVEPIRCLRYAVVSAEPEDDAINHVKIWAQRLKIDNPRIIGWDFPAVSQEQINVYSMHGYAAALESKILSFIAALLLTSKPYPSWSAPRPSSTGGSSVHSPSGWEWPCRLRACPLRRPAICRSARRARP